MKETRIEKDSLGPVEVPLQAHWKAQTQRSLQNFPIGSEKMPHDLIDALAYLKLACAIANEKLGIISKDQKEAIIYVCQKIIKGELYQDFPLSVWQTGSGTQTNMNLNEVISTLGNEWAGKDLLHPNDTVNASQSSNDVFPSAIHIMCAKLVKEKLFSALDQTIDQFRELEEKHQGIIKMGRTHLQDATPMYFSQEISGWRSMLEHSRHHLESALPYVYELAIGGSAIGTGINVPEGFSADVIAVLRKQLGINFKSDPNLFHALSSKDGLSFLSGALQTLAANCLKIANDIRFLASGPRGGLGEIRLPENEPGSSIMPGKVNPTQCEALAMVSVQVMANHNAINIANSQGHFQLNVFMPLIAYDLHQSITLLSEALDSFRLRALKGLQGQADVMKERVQNSLMIVTALSPHIGYENAAKAARKAYLENTSLKEAVLALGLLDEAQTDIYLDVSRILEG